MPKATWTLPEFVKWMKLGAPEQVKQFTEREARRLAHEAKRLAQDKLGSYQPAIGGYPEWPPLKPETIAKRQGADMPLLDWGTLRDSIRIVEPAEESPGHFITGIGSDLDYAAVQELGYPEKNIPPRPYMGPAVWEVAHKKAKRIGTVAMEGMMPGSSYSFTAGMGEGDGVETD